MKSRVYLYCVCAIAMLLLCNAASAAILSSGSYDWDEYGGGDANPGYTSSHGSASADGECTYSTAWAEGNYYIYTTTYGSNFTITRSLYVYAMAHATIDGGSASAAAGASASISSPNYIRSAPSKYVSAYDYVGILDDDTDSWYYSFSGYLYANDGFSCTHEIAAYGAASEGGWDSAYAYADASSWTSVYQQHIDTDARLGAASMMRRVGRDTDVSNSAVRFGGQRTMFDGYTHEGPMPDATSGPHSTPPRAFIAASTLAVLLFLAAGRDVTRARAGDGTTPQCFEFTCEFQLRMGRGHLDGRMATDGANCRVTVYWTEPDVFREAASFIRHVDLILTEDSAHYWIYPGTQHGTLPARRSTAEPLFPRERSVNSVVRSALAVAGRMGPPEDGQDVPLHVGRFFQRSRDLAQYTYRAQTYNADANDPSSQMDVDTAALNSRPSGREYSKERHQDGITEWRIKKALPAVLVTVVTIKPVTGAETIDCGRLFDADTLGQSALVPPAYRAYWSFDRALLELAESPDPSAASRDLCARFESCLRGEDVPLEVRKALYRLWFKAASATQEMDPVRTCVQAMVAGVHEDTAYGNYRGLLELARCSGEIQIQFPQNNQEWLRPLVGEMVKRAGGDAGRCFTKLMPLIDMNQWFLFGRLFLEETRRQGLLEQDSLRDMTVQFEATRSARETPAPDPCELSPRVRDYLTWIEREPPGGSIDMETLRHIIEEGLAAADVGSDPQARRILANGVIRSIRLIVGEGPFQGNADALRDAIERFSQRFRKAYGSDESIGPVLATFLGLSFCDLSIADDHDTLLAQLARRSADLQAQVHISLSERGLGPLLTTQEVADMFRRWERVSAELAHDPLWPTHKFPLTRGEETMLAGRLTLALLQQKPLLDDIAVKFKYGGASEELKGQLIRGISRVVQQAICEACFLRRPCYPGISCDYQGTLGFTVSIEGPLYEEGKRPREIFTAMKYFHLGQRLDDVVRREQELAAQTTIQESIQ